METLWASQSFQRERVVLRLRLRPYACGHEVNLCQIQSPFVLGGDCTFHDLCTAVLLCSHTFEEGQKLIRNPYKAILMSRVWGWLMRALARHPDSKRKSDKPLGPEMFHGELRKFQGYIYDGTWAPETHKVIGGYAATRTLIAPRVYRLVPFLCASLGLTESQAMNFPMARANAYYAAMADRAGEIDLVDGDDPLLKHLANLEARAEKGEKVWDF